MRRWITVAATLALSGSLGAAHGPWTPQDSEAEPAPAESALKLAKMPKDVDAALAQAAQSNPSLRLSENAVERAMALLADETLKVTQNAIIAYTRHRSAAALRDEAELRQETLKQQQAAGLVSTSDLLAHQISRFKMLQDIGAVEAEARYLLAGAEVPETLDEMLTLTLERCTSLRVAQIELERARALHDEQHQQVIRDVRVEFQELQVLRLMEQRVREQVAQSQALADRGFASQEEVSSARNKLTAARADISRAEAQLRYLLGLGVQRR